MPDDPWTFLAEGLPAIEPGKYRSKALLLTTWEFDMGKMLAVGYMFHSTAPNQEPTWYYDEEFYGMTHPHQVAMQVIAWMPMPEMPELEVAWETK